MYDDYLRSKLSMERIGHSLNVAQTASELAERFKLNVSEAYQAGLLHDAARDIEEKELLILAEKEGLITDPVEKMVPVLLHGPVGSYLLKQELGLESENILQAVKYHTTGHKDMTALDALIYLADVIEPGRKFQGVETLRRTARHNLWQGVLHAMDRSLNYIIEKRHPIHPITITARNWLLSKQL